MVVLLIPVYYSYKSVKRDRLKMLYACIFIYNKESGVISMLNNMRIIKPFL